AVLGLWKNGGNLSAAQAFVENTEMVQASGNFWLSGILIVLFVELAYIEEIAFSDVPMLHIAGQLGIPAVAPLFSFILLAGIFSTTAPLLWSVSVRLAFALRKTTAHPFVCSQ
ncbi:MAG: hypothetical protein SCK57_09780, partial [Bacillota bacterium]|nr:hypothetical protein [Bacillota bacterium]